MKNSIKNTFKNIGVFLLIYILSLFFVYSLLIALENINLINRNISNIIFPISMILLLILTWIILRVLRAKKKKNFFATPNLYKYGLLYIFTMRFLSSIKSTVVISLEEAKSLLTIEWTICIALIAAIVTWCIVVEHEIKNDSNENENMFGSEHRVSKIIKKYNTQQSAAHYLWNAIPTIVSLFVMHSITASILIDKKISLFIQTLLYFNLNVLVFALLIIVIDIMLPTITKLAAKGKIIKRDEYYDEMIEGVLEDDLIELAKKNNNNFDNLSKEDQSAIIKELYKKHKTKQDFMKQFLKNQIKNFKFDDDGNLIDNNKKLNNKDALD